MKRNILLVALALLSAMVFAQTPAQPAPAPATDTAVVSAPVAQSQDVIINSQSGNLAFNKLVVFYDNDKKVQVTILKGAQAQVAAGKYRLELSGATGRRINFYLEVKTNVKIDFQKSKILLAGDYSYYLTDDVK